MATTKRPCKDADLGSMSVQSHATGGVSVTATKNAPGHYNLTEHTGNGSCTALTGGLDLKLEITFVLVQRSVGQTASSTTYPPAALYNHNVCACNREARTEKPLTIHYITIIIYISFKLVGSKCVYCFK